MFEFELPNPLHPAIVHLPIVLTLLGTVLALLSIITRRLRLPLYAALILVLAAIGAQVAVSTGDAQDQLFSTLTTEQKTFVEAHSDMGENGRTALIVAAALALIALALHRFGASRRFFAVLTTLAGCVACFFVLRAAQLGGHLVYQHGIGVQREAAGATSPSAAAPPAGSPASQ
jgi:uncharacterized membrane protein